MRKLIIALCLASSCHTAVADELPKLADGMTRQWFWDPPLGGWVFSQVKPLDDCRFIDAVDHQHTPYDLPGACSVDKPTSVPHGYLFYVQLEPGGPGSWLPRWYFPTLRACEKARAKNAAEQPDTRVICSQRSPGE
jgi:hypothetical protein